MTTHPTHATPPLGRDDLVRAKRPLVPSAVLGSLIFVAAEVMFFSGIMSALTISRAGAPPGTWPPAGQPSLASPAGQAGIALVLASGGLLLAARRLVARGANTARHLLLGAALLGAAFVALQLQHGSALVASGLTMRSSQQASFFFLVTGLHTMHAAATLVALLVAWRRLGRGALSPGFFAAVQVFWAFVVVMWPVIYARVFV